MLRAFLCSAAALAVLMVGLARADQKKSTEVKKSTEAKVNQHHAWFVSADQKAKPPTITFKVKDKTGKQKEMTLPLAKNAKIYGEKHDAEKLATFVANMAKEKDKAVLLVEDKEGRHIVELTDLPPKK